MFLTNSIGNDIALLLVQVEGSINQMSETLSTYNKYIATQSKICTDLYHRLTSEKFKNIHFEQEASYVYIGR